MDFPDIAMPFSFALLWRLRGQVSYGFIAEEPSTFFIMGCRVSWINGPITMSLNTLTPATTRKPKWKSERRTPSFFGHTSPWLAYF